MNDASTSHRFVTIPLLLISTALFMNQILGQDLHSSFYRESVQINNMGMMVLGTWAVANIATGIYGWSTYSGQRMYFHQMNLFWNSVNLGIAGLALYGNYATDYTRWPPVEILERQLKTQHIFLLNAGLDVVYMGTGLVLRNIASQYPKNETRLKGYGNSVIFQGGFLFVFDLVMYGLQLSHRKEFLQHVSIRSMSEAMGISLAINL